MADASLSFNILTKYQDSGINRAEKDMKSFDATTKRTSGSMKKFAIVGAGAVAAGAIVAGKALFNMTKNAAEDEAGQRRLAIALRNTAGATKKQAAEVEGWISAQGRATGVADDEMRPALQRLVQSTGKVGLGQKQLKIAMDVSAGSGKSLKVVTEAMAKANNGNVGALSKLGLKTKDAEGKTLSMRDAVKKMSDQFKGQSTAAARTFDGKMDRLKLTFDEAKETVGAKLLPMLTRLAGWFLNKGLPAVSKFGGWIRDNLGPIFNRVKGIISNATGAIEGDVSGNLGLVKDTIKDFVTIARVLWDRFGGTIIGIVKRAFSAVRSIIKGALLVIRGIIRVVAGLLTGDWAKAWAGIKDIVRGAKTVVVTIIRTLFSNAKAIFRAAGGALRDAAVTIWAGIKQAFAAGADKVVAYVRKLPARIKSGLASLSATMLGIGKDAIQGMINGIRAKFSELLPTVRNLIDQLPGAAKKLLGIASPSKIFIQIGKFTVDGLIEGLESKRGELKGKVKSLVQASADVASGFQASFGASLFGADFGGEDGTGTASIGGILEYQKQQAAKANALKSNVKALVSKGLSKDLIGQLLAAGASGEAQISALAGGSKAQIAELNSLNKATNSSLSSAGSSLGNALYGDRIAAARKEVRQVNYVINVSGALDANATARQIKQLLLELKRKERIDLGLA